MTYHLCPVLPARPNEYLTYLRQAVSTLSPETGVMRATFAYATVGGVQEFRRSVSEEAPWESIQKEFVIGLHHAITEPAALSELARLPHSTVKVFIPKNRLSIDTFSDSPTFHPKMIALCSGRPKLLRFIQAGSANQTSAALSSPPGNVEFGVALASTATVELDGNQQFGEWWRTLWTRSRPIDSRFISRYAALRANVLDKNPLLRHAVDPPRDLSNEQHFFIEVGAGSGPPTTRHQVEFPEGLARFFGPVQRRQRLIRLTDGNHVWTNRPLSFKTTTYGVEIWRLGMPTQASGGEPISERAIRFEKTHDPDTFAFAIADVPSQEFDEWALQANTTGHVGATRGLRSRIYGFYS